MSLAKSMEAPSNHGISSKSHQIHFKFQNKNYLDINLNLNLLKVNINGLKQKNFAKF